MDEQYEYIDNNKNTWTKVAGSTPDGVLAALWPWDRLNEERGISCEVGGKGGRCVGLTTLPPSCAECLDVMGVSTFRSPKGLA